MKTNRIKAIEAISVPIGIAAISIGNAAAKAPLVISKPTRSDCQACATASPPAVKSPRTVRITSAVMVQITTVSMKGSSSDTKPSVIGSLVRTAEWAMAAEPTPASLEKAARLKP